MRKGIAGLAAVAQDVLRQNPCSGAVFAFRGRRGDRVKLALLGEPSARHRSECRWRKRAFASTTRSWRKADFPGHRRRTEPLGSRRRSWRCCGKALTGGDRNGLRLRRGLPDYLIDSYR